MRVLLVLLATITIAKAECRFTPEQNAVLHLAYAVGQPHDLGYTMAALAWKEGFVGRYIVRINPNDGEHGSYGVTHVLLTTAMWMLDVDSTWEAKAKLAPKMMNDDIYTLHLSLEYLQRFDHLPWRQQIAKYNGAGQRAEAYAEDVVKRVGVLTSCKYFSQGIDNTGWVD